jgi:imidazolonepropionase-like amidohydrolase
MSTILTNCTIIDCAGNPPAEKKAIKIVDGRIAALDDDFPEAGSKGEDARVFDLNGRYVLPGFWDVHEHLGDIYPDPTRLMLRESVAERTIRAGRNAIDALRAGITGVRVVGEAFHLDVAWREAFDKGLFIGPRLVVCGNIILATGGHGHGWPGALEVDGPYEMRKAVREQLKHGVDQVKLSVTGGVQTPGETMQESQLLFDEIKAATDVAHEKGKRVCVHGGGAAGIKNAIRAGVDCIEHGYYLDDECIDLMVENDVYYVPTITVTQYEPFMKESGMADYQLDKARSAARAHREGLQKANAAGVKIASGADLCPIAELGIVEIEQLVRAGLTETEALVAATRTSAELCEMGDDLGTIEVGKLADLVVLSQNPLEDISNIRKLDMVFKAGKKVNVEQEEGLADFWDLYF